MRNPFRTRYRVVKTQDGSFAPQRRRFWEGTWKTLPRCFWCYEITHSTYHWAEMHCQFAGARFDEIEDATA